MPSIGRQTATVTSNAILDFLNRQGAVRDRAGVLPLVKTDEGLGLGWPQSVIDMFKAIKLPEASLKGYQATPEDIANFALNVGVGGIGASTFAGPERGVGTILGANVVPRKVSTKTPSIRDQPLTDVLPLVRSQAHLIPKPGGGYVGAPPWVKTPRDLAKLRKRIDAAVEQGVEGASWYDRARAANRELTGGDPTEGDWMAGQHALFSAQRTPSVETGHVLEDLNTAIASGGVPAKTNQKLQQIKTQAAYAAGDPAVLRKGLGAKTAEYEKKINPSNAQALATGSGVNDLWHGRLFGYEEKTKSTGLSGPAHTFMDYETALAADRANKRGLGGMTDWSGAKIQAAPWVQLKGEGLYKEGTSRFNAEARKALGKEASQDEVVALARQFAFDEANRTQGDFLDKFTAFATNEPQPYGGAGHLPGLAQATPEEKLAFADDPRSSWSPEGRDVLYADTRVPGGPAMRVRPTLRGQGVYTPPEGPTEYNPVNISRPMVSVKGGEVEPGARSLLNAGEAIRGYVDVQGGTPWHKPIANTELPPGEKNSFFADLGRPVSQAERLKAQEIGAKYDLGDVMDVGQGLTFTKFPDPEAVPPRLPREPMEPAEVRALLRELTEAGLPVTKGERVKLDSDYPWYEGLWEEGGGAATRKLLERLDEAPAGARAAFDANPSIPRAALERLERDEALVSRYGATRADIQNARRIIGKGPGWTERLREALNRGEVLPAIALPLLGVVPWAHDDD